MTKNEVDIEDILNYFVYFVFSFLSFEWMDWQIPVINTDLNFVLYTFNSPLQEVSITFPRVVLFLSLCYLLWTNDLNLDTRSASQLFIIGALAWMVISPPFVPMMYLVTSDVAFASIIAFFIQSLGWALVMYRG